MNFFTNILFYYFFNKLKNNDRYNTSNDGVFVNYRMKSHVHRVYTLCQRGFGTSFCETNLNRMNEKETKFGSGLLVNTNILTQKVIYRS